MEAIKRLRRTQYLISNTVIVFSSILLLITIQSGNRNAVILTILVLSLPKLISDSFYKGAYPWVYRYISSMRKLIDYEREQLGDNEHANVPTTIWSWVFIAVAVFIVYFTDFLYFEHSFYLLLFMFSISLVSSNISMATTAKKADANKHLIAFVKKVTVMFSGIGVLVMSVVALIIRL